MTVGALARATGVTVRAPHHYDRLGLLRPARDGAGRRRYGPADVRRLHQIVVLRSFGRQVAELRRQREEQVSRLSPAELTAMQQRRREMLPDEVA